MNKADINLQKQGITKLLFHQLQPVNQTITIKQHSALIYK